jgi:hypothetical protein
MQEVEDRYVASFLSEQMSPMPCLILFSCRVRLSSRRPTTQPKDAEWSSSLAESMGDALSCTVAEPEFKSWLFPCWCLLDRHSAVASNHMSDVRPHRSPYRRSIETEDAPALHAPCR